MPGHALAEVVYGAQLKVACAQVTVTQGVAHLHINLYSALCGKGTVRQWQGSLSPIDQNHDLA
jgi:hypothetical protein